jgi:GNAT superfamily N-acetyltransferase
MIPDMTPTIRRAIPTDVIRLSRLRWDYRLEDGEVPTTTYDAFAARYAAFVRAGLSSGEWAYFVAESEGEIVAHMAVQVVRAIPRPSRVSDQWGYLTDVYTRPAWRGRGVGTAILRYLTAWARVRDLEMLLVSPSDQSRPFYARAGFADGTELMTLALRGWNDPPPVGRRASDAAREDDAAGKQHDGQPERRAE